MTTIKKGIDESFIRAYATNTRAPITTTTPTPIMHNTEMVKVALPLGATKMSAVFDPVSNEQNYKTRLLNQTVRKGFALPTSFTK